ncbi:TetR/AcrR family transcriptional regulator [Fulvivirga sediminis]|uniref:TetR/AcrR family transcriptional regulator n=1 Tax=Fulvivirga sediminis TaxID=2803949 RepID=A0A937JYE4_9BACT|nr:TetR/AcrR family transcriptional regulator [Fulvivirga sediminis]MBL3656348.1 TetR/AcrR family transcriptional regulator [Fulvivirga sediminis]
MGTDTKQNIIDAAIFIFNEDFSAPLEKVATHAGVTRRTLHRYFRDREELLHACMNEMQLRCRQGMEEAERSSDEPLVKLENMLYAAVSCGEKYAFLYKLHNQHDHQHSSNDEECRQYDSTFSRIMRVIQKLKEEDRLSENLTLDWVSVLFNGIVNTAVNSLKIKNMEYYSVKKQAWHSLRRAILK